MLTDTKPLQTISYYLNILSALCDSLIVIFILTIMVINKKLVDRVSLRFTLAISFFDCLRSITLIFHSQHREDGLACVAISFSIHWLTLVYLFLTVSIAFNLQLVFLKGKKFQSRWELYYWGVSLTTATVLLLVPLSLGRLGLDDKYQYCEFIDNTSTETFAWRTSFYVIWIFLSVIYCTVIVIKVILHLRRRVSVLAQVSNESGFSLGPVKCAQLQRDLKRLITRISFYCLIPLVTQIGYCVSKIYCFLWGLPPTPILYASNIGLDLTGILNFIAFMMDPAFSVAINSILPNRSTTTIENRSSPSSSSGPFLKSKTYHHLTNSMNSQSTGSLSVSDSISPKEVERLLESSFISPTVPMRELSRSHSPHPSAASTLPTSPFTVPAHLLRFGSTSTLPTTTTTFSNPSNPTSLPNTASILGSLLYQDQPSEGGDMVGSRTHRNATSVCNFIRGL